MKYNFSILVEQDKDGFVASCPELQGCYAQGATYEEVMKNIKNVIELHLDDRKEMEEEIERPYFLSLSTIEVAVA